jgi:hypothetical protein
MRNGPPPGEAQRGPDEVGVRRNHHLPRRSPETPSPLRTHTELIGPVFTYLTFSSRWLYP